MKTNEIIAKARRKSTIELQKSLSKEISAEQKEAIEFVLKSRGIEITSEVEVVKEIEKIEVEKEIVEEKKEVVEEKVQEPVVLKEKKQRVSKAEKDNISDYDFKKGDEVSFLLFKTKEKVTGILKKIYQCKFTGVVYTIIEHNGKIVHKRANVISHV